MADLLMASTCLIVIPFALRRIANVVRTQPRILLGADDRVQLELMLRKGTFLVGSSVIVCGVTHLLAGLGQRGQWTHLFSSWATALISTATGVYLSVQHFSQIYELVARIEILPRGETQKITAQSTTFSQALNELKSELTSGLRRIDQGQQARLAALETKIEAVMPAISRLEASLERQISAHGHLLARADDANAELRKQLRAIDVLLKLILAGQHAWGDDSVKAVLDKGVEFFLERFQRPRAQSSTAGAASSLSADAVASASNSAEQGSSWTTDSGNVLEVGEPQPASLIASLSSPATPPRHTRALAGWSDRPN